MASWLGSLVQFLYRTDSDPELAASLATPYFIEPGATSATTKPRCYSPDINEFRQSGSLMKPYLPDHIIVALAGFACLCVLIFLGLSLSPAFAATLSRGTDVGNTLSAARSTIYPIYAIKWWRLSFGACARRPIDRIVSLF
jgi:hypothetical protein